ncbi:MAG: formylglycine-generating enzyme family protein [Desulfuromusa sp.]|nr:formylglycine-generating enzyme family protein [Desulfuromusa sp.]
MKNKTVADIILITVMLLPIGCNPPLVPSSDSVTSVSTGVDFTEPTNGAAFVFVRGGCFQMGSNDGDSDEKPVHKVCVNDYHISKYEITQAQYQKITDSNPSRFKGDDHPIKFVSWDDAQSYILQLNTRSGKSYRLPTEAEWEYAARSGGKNEKYAGGNNVDAVAWYAGNSGGKTHPVGQKQPNGLGLYDMSGNVWEWCKDRPDSSYYGKSPRNNPQGSSTGTGLNNSYRVTRGGSWCSVPWSLRSTRRSWSRSGDRNCYLGFRLVLP